MLCFLFVNFYVLLNSLVKYSDPDSISGQVVKKVEVRVRSVEDIWAVRLINFIIRANQLLFEGLTRELPL